MTSKGLKPPLPVWPTKTEVTFLAFKRNYEDQRSFSSLRKLWMHRKHAPVVFEVWQALTHGFHYPQVLASMGFPGSNPIDTEAWLYWEIKWYCPCMSNLNPSFSGEHWFSSSNNSQPFNNQIHTSVKFISVTIFLSFLWPFHYAAIFDH